MFPRINFGTCVSLSALILAVLGRGAAAPTEKMSRTFTAERYARRTIYHSPQTPGWTSWVGAWIMPDGSLMVSFTRATGPVGDLERRKKTRDYGGLDIDVVYLRSTDGGARWTRVAESDVSFGTADDSGLGTHANNGPTTLALKDGSILRRVYGWDYGRHPAIPGTAFLQRSMDGGKTWSDPPRSRDGGGTWSDPSPVQEFLIDPARYTVQTTRTRRLRDGRLLMGGGVWNGPNTQRAPFEPLLMVSADEARSWQRVNFTRAEYDAAWNTKWNEWDLAELPGGDLLVVSRTADNRQRWQGILAKAGGAWGLRTFGPSVLPHSGHPELLKTREGPVLHIATTGTHWTDDGGKTWHPLDFDTLPDLPTGDYQSRYYPHSLQTADGWVYVFSHKGYDNYYGQVDQAIVMDRFRLTRK